MKSTRYYIAALSVIAALGVIAALSVPVVLAEKGPEAPPGARAIPNCEVKGSIDKTSVGCPTDGSPTVVCNLDLDTSNFGLDIEKCCTCNVAAGQEFIECDPTITDPGAPGACPQGDEVHPFAGEPRSIIEGGHNLNNTCIYITILDKRTSLCQPTSSQATSSQPTSPNQRSQAKEEKKEKKLKPEDNQRCAVLSGIRKCR